MWNELSKFENGERLLKIAGNVLAYREGWHKDTICGRNSVFSMMQIQSQLGLIKIVCWPNSCLINPCLPPLLTITDRYFIWFNFLPSIKLQMFFHGLAPRYSRNLGYNSPLWGKIWGKLKYVRFISHSECLRHGDRWSADDAPWKPCTVVCSHLIVYDLHCWLIGVWSHDDLFVIFHNS